MDEEGVACVLEMSVNWERRQISVIEGGKREWRERARVFAPEPLGSDKRRHVLIEMPLWIVSARWARRAGR